MSSRSSFEDQGILVVEGTRGIAPAVILRAAERQATIVFTTLPEHETTATQIVAQAQAAGLGDRVSYFVSDATDEDGVERLVDTALERLPSLDVLIHNLEPRAAVEQKALADISLAEWNQVLSTELRVPFMLTRRVVEEFLFARIHGRIVFIAYSGSEAVKGSARYLTAQAGLRALVRCTMKEFGRREVASNAVIVRGDPGANPPEELAETALFFASREASFVNGEFVDMNNLLRHQPLFALQETKVHAER